MVSSAGLTGTMAGDLLPDATAGDMLADAVAGRLLVDAMAGDMLDATTGHLITDVMVGSGEVTGGVMGVGVMRGGVSVEAWLPDATGRVGGGLSPSFSMSVLDVVSCLKVPSWWLFPTLLWSLLCSASSFVPV